MEFRSKSVSVEVNLIPQLPPCWIFSSVTSAIARQIQVLAFTKQPGSLSEIAVKEKKEGKKNYLPQNFGNL